jgi:hypothetical protein
MDYGMKNSRLRKQIDELQAEKRRLLLAREVSLSPMELKKAVKKAGFSEAEPAVPVVTQAAVTTPAKTKDKTLPVVAETKKTVVKTASVSAVPTSVAAVYPKADRAERVVKQVKKQVAAE